MRAHLTSHRWFVFSQPMLVLFSVGVSLTWLTLNALALPPGAADAETSRQKLAAEISAVDAVTLRVELLNAAEQNAADRELTNWYDEKVMQEGQWISLEAAIQLASEDTRLAEYRRRRESLIDNAAAHEKTARWCQKQKLFDQANVHWLHILRFQPHHRAALNELQLSWHDGQLLARDEVEGYQAQEKEFQKQKKRWKSKAARLRRDLEKGKPAERIAARKELHEVREPAAVPALVEEFAEKGATEEKTVERQIELIATLGGIKDPEAMRTILDFAVGSPREQVRYAAINQLKSKNLHEYVPVLLSEMRMPVEGSVSFNQIGSKIVSTYSYGQEGPGGQLYENSQHRYRNIPGQRYIAAPVYRSRRVPPELLRESYDIPERHHSAAQCGGHVVPAHTHPAQHFPEVWSKERTEYDLLGYNHGEDPNYQYNKKRSIQASQAEASGVASRVNQFNQDIIRQNEQIADVLIQVTGETLDVFPKSWWNWWSNYLDNHPDVAATGARQQLNAALLNQSSRGLARGTWIWTLEGLRAVETILPGDYVLAQDPDSGELAYKTVLAIDVPRELTVTKLDIEKSSIHCAPGHVVWRSGTGWRRVSKLVSSDSLHGVEVGLQLEQSTESFTIDCYDLIVDGFHTFFVGESGLLVHDATPIKPAYVALPGFSSAAVAGAVQLAAATNR